MSSTKRDVTDEYGNRAGLDIILVGPSITSIGKIVDAETLEDDRTDVGFVVVGEAGTITGNLYVKEDRADVLCRVVDAQRMRIPLIIQGVAMDERHPITGNRWLTGTIRPLVDRHTDLQEFV